MITQPDVLSGDALVRFNREVEVQRLLNEGDMHRGRVIEIADCVTPEWKEYFRRLRLARSDPSMPIPERPPYPLPYEDEAEPEPEPEPAPYTPNFTIIPEQLAKYAEADESAEDFRKRAFSILFRFGIAEGENFEGGGEPLSPEEKIRLLPMLIANFAAGNWLNLTEDLKP